MTAYVLRGLDEQVAGLASAAAALPKSIGWTLRQDPGDVPWLAATERTGLQIVYAAGGFDVWLSGEPVEFDVSAERAIDVLVNGWGA